jgi:hypothetical protein
MSSGWPSAVSPLLPLMGLGRARRLLSSFKT